MGQSLAHILCHSATVHCCKTQAPKIDRGNQARISQIFPPASSHRVGIIILTSVFFSVVKAYWRNAPFTFSLYAVGVFCISGLADDMSAFWVSLFTSENIESHKEKLIQATHRYEKLVEKENKPNKNQTPTKNPNQTNPQTFLHKEMESLPLDLLAQAAQMLLAVLVYPGSKSNISGKHKSFVYNVYYGSKQSYIQPKKWELCSKSTVLSTTIQRSESLWCTFFTKIKAEKEKTPKLKQPFIWSLKPLHE